MTDEDTLLHRLDVHVAGLGLDGALHDQIDEIDDWRGLAALLEAHDLLEHFFFGTARQAGFAHRQVGARRAAARAPRRPPPQYEIGPPPLRARNPGFFGVAGLNGVDDFAARRDHLLDAVTRLKLEILDKAEQQRIGHRHREQVLFETNRNADALDGDFFGNQHHRRGIGRVLDEVDVWEAEL